MYPSFKLQTTRKQTISVRATGKTLGFAAVGLVLTLLLAACADSGYYWQSVAGHLQVMQKARPIEQWLKDGSAAAPLKQRLALAQRIRRFAVSELKLPDNASYHSYADLQRSSVVWNVVAASEFSLALKTWCVPVAGCVSYRGYFDAAQARAQAQALAAQGLEVQVYGVPAYSTLGWLNWAGGDPLLNTFIHRPEGELARMIFHELAHQVLYVRDDTQFNESFASAVERIGAEQWLRSQAAPLAKSEYAKLESQRQQLRALALSTRLRLTRIYQQNESPGIDKTLLRAQKNKALQEFRDDYARLKSDSGWDNAYDTWVAGANNAALGAQAAYDDWVSAFESLFERADRDWLRFYADAKRLSERPKSERDESLRQLVRQRQASQ